MGWTLCFNLQWISCIETSKPQSMHSCDVRIWFCTQVQCWLPVGPWASLDTSFLCASDSKSVKQKLESFLLVIFLEDKMSWCMSIFTIVFGSEEPSKERFKNMKEAGSYKHVYNQSNDIGMSSRSCSCFSFHVQPFLFLPSFPPLFLPTSFFLSFVL